MPWFKVDDSFPGHRKVLAIPRRDRPAAVGLWTLAGGWCAQQLTDGHLGAHLVEEFCSSKRYADLLVRVGLWETTDEGYRFHDWLDWQPSRESVLAEREAAKERMRRARQRKRSAEHPPNEQPNVGRTSGEVRVTPTRPDPTRPKSVETSGGSSGPVTRTTAPPPRCPKHQQNPSTGPCGPCGDARRSHDQWHRDRADKVRPTFVACPDHTDQPAGRCVLCVREVGPPPTGWRAAS